MFIQHTAKLALLLTRLLLQSAAEAENLIIARQKRSEKFAFKHSKYSAQWDKPLINGSNDFFRNMHTLIAHIKYQYSDLHSIIKFATGHNFQSRRFYYS